MALKNKGVCMDIQQVIQRWIDSISIQGVSSHTLVAYRTDVNVFVEYCEKHALELINIEAPDLREYLMWLMQARQLSNKSATRHLVSIRAFMSWLFKSGYIEVNNAVDVKLKLRESHLPGMLDIETVNILLDQPEPEGINQQRLWVRDKAMMELLYSSGLRVSELANLKFKDIDKGRLQVRVIGKGNKERVVPVGRKAIAALLAWCEIYRERYGEFGRDDYIFVSQKRGQITIDQIERRVKYHAKRAGLKENVYPHLLRHSFATHMLQGSGDIRAVQEMLGHASLSTTQIYTNLDTEFLMRSYDKAHPRASKKPD